MAAGFFLYDKEIFHLKNVLLDRIYSEIKAITKQQNQALTVGEQVIMDQLYLLTFGWDVSLERILLTKHLAFFLATMIKKGLDTIQKSPNPYSENVSQLFQNLYVEIIQFAKTLPDKATRMQITWYKGTYEIL